jgi:hypothetical protein
MLLSLFSIGYLFLSINVASFDASEVGFHCYKEDNPDYVLNHFNIKLLDIGFGVEVHGVEGEYLSHIFNENRSLKEIETDELALGFWTIESNMGIGRFGDDGFIYLLNAITKLSGCSLSVLDEDEKDLLHLSFPNFKGKKVSYYIDKNKNFIIASPGGEFRQIEVIYNTARNGIVINGFIRKK